MNKPGKIAYRTDIDGLRALAVTLVVLFHAGFGFKGGYVGVDVFFVISGYLITSIIVAQQEAGTFRLARFWQRRIRRILPASLLVVFTTLIAGYFLYLPEDLKQLSESAIYQQFFMANVYFWHDSGYFAAPSEIKPLLHTWSLAVEEQFYLIFPLCMAVSQRISKKKLASLLFLGFCISFGLSVYFVQDHPGATFYSLPTRAWELLLGCLLAVIKLPVGMRKWQSTLIGMLGLVGILYPGIYYNSQTVFPGAAALLPCLGAMALMESGRQGSYGVPWLLSLKPVVFVGKISYSLYLWHWPLLAFQTYWFGNEVSSFYRAIVVLCSFGLAVISYYFVEKTFRDNARSGSLSFQKVVASVLVVTFGVCVVSLYGVFSGGAPGRCPQSVHRVLADVERPEHLLVLDRDALACDEDDLPFIGSVGDPSAPDFLIWGDSHARAVVPVFDIVANELGMSGVVACRSGVPPLAGDLRSFSSNSRLAWNNSVLNYVERNQVRHVLLVSRWDNVAKSFPGNDFRDSVRETILALRSNGAQVWIMAQVPEQEHSFGRGIALAAWANWPMPLGGALADYRLARERSMGSFVGVGVDLLDPLPYCFTEQGRSVVAGGGRAFYRDGDHLSGQGAVTLLKPLAEKFLNHVHESIVSEK